MPYVLELLRYWRDWPPTHMLTRWHVGYKSPTWISDEQPGIPPMIPASNVATFDKLPASYQAYLMKQAGCETYQEYEAYCKRVANGEPDLTLKKVSIN